MLSSPVLVLVPLPLLLLQQQTPTLQEREPHQRPRSSMLRCTGACTRIKYGFNIVYWIRDVLIPKVLEAKHISNPDVAPL